MAYFMNSKTRSVQKMIDKYCVDAFSFRGFLLNDADRCIVLTHSLFRLVMRNKFLWAVLPSDCSCINYVLRHLRFMLTNVDYENIKQYAIEHFFYRKYE